MNRRHSTGRRSLSGGHGGQIYNAANRLIADNKFLYSYDAEGNLTARTDRVLMVTTTYSYDAEHRLRAVTKPSGQATTYKYDPLGRRIEVAGPTQTKRYAYGLDQNMAAEYDESNNRLATYTFGLGMDTPLAMRRGGANSYYLQDALGSVTSLTNQSGAVTQRYEYGAFGQPLTTGENTGNPFTYTGREWDSAQNAYHYRARNYDAAAGVFISEDPIASLNSSVYVENNPVSLRDPSGMSVVDNLAATIATNSVLIRIATQTGVAGGLARTVIRAAQSRVANVVIKSNHATSSVGPGHAEIAKLNPAQLRSVERLIENAARAASKKVDVGQVFRGTVKYGDDVIEFKGFVVNPTRIDVNTFWMRAPGT